MRLIDADALKEVLINNYEAKEHCVGELFLEAIDNSPTVEPEPYFEKAEKDKRIYERGFEDGQNAR